MHTYTIKKDGFDLGQARGKDKAVKRLKKHMEFEGELQLKQEWKTIAGTIYCKVNNGMDTTYSIEKEN